MINPGGFGATLGNVELPTDVNNMEITSCWVNHGNARTLNKWTCNHLGTLQLQSPVWGLFWQIGSALQKSVTRAAKYFDENGMSEDDFESFLDICLESSRVPPSEAAGSHHRLFKYPYQRHNSCETASGLLQSGSMYWGSACFPKHVQWQLERACFHPVNAV